jgi:hypothetical protein
MSEFIAVLHTCRQYSEDGYESVHKLMKLTPETTIREIMEWASGHPFEKSSNYGPITIEEVSGGRK